ncbi:MAG: YdeI/OmpD-associated family protein [Rhodothermales bacterium]|nr:YdeI/OmpD-associated family protein [Rhodothermales bacterium]
MPPPDSFHPPTRPAWRAWLAEHHDRDAGLWLIRYKKAAGKPTLSYADVVEEALCFGWIDSLPRALDAERTMLYVAPRKPGSGWSRLNKERAERLIRAGRMTPAGQAKIDAAKADGSWNALDAVEALTVPDDLAAAFAQHPGAAAHWDAFPRSVKRGILEWITTAKRADTRRRRIDETARKAQRNERANQWRR